MNRGYAGYYNGIYLRSSYEYAYALYLDHKKIKWRYEEKKYDLDYCVYIPDFFIYNQDENLLYVVDTKSKDKKQIKLTEEKLEKLNEKFEIKGEVVTYEHLLSLYKDMPQSLTKTINDWIRSDKTTLNKSQFGEKNPHFDIKHSDETKKIIGEMTRKRWKDPKLKEKMIEGSKKGAKINHLKKGKWHVKKRVIRECEYDECNNKFTVIETSKKRFCNYSCSALARERSNFKQRVRTVEDKHFNIKSYIDKWILDNSKFVKGIPVNKIKPSLDLLLNEVNDKFNIRDVRTITKAVIGEEEGRQSLLYYMKELVEKHEATIIEQSELIRRNEVKDFIHEWAFQNKNYIQSASYKSVRKTLRPLGLAVSEKFNYKFEEKMRILQRSIFNYDKGCTEVLLYLKTICEDNENVR